jgi:AraC-like DNA-binding protein
MDVFDKVMSIFDLMALKAPPPGFLDSHTKRGRHLFLETTSARHAFGVVCAGWEECHADFQINRPSFPYPTIELLAAGDWVLGTGKNAQLTGSGALVLYGPSSPIALAATGPGPHRKYFLVLSGYQTSNHLEQAGIPPHETLVHVHQGPLMELYEQIITCSELPESQRKAVATALAKAFLLRAGASRLGPSAKSRPDGTAFERCRAYVESHYPEIISIRSAAEACHVTLEHFSRLFRKFTGTTAERFLSSLRVNHAARMLQQTDLTIKSIALTVGFKDPYHFSKAFKKIHSVSPQKFRDQFH